jgi:hypothetical protein
MSLSSLSFTPFHAVVGVGHAMKHIFGETIYPLKKDDFPHVCSYLWLMSNNTREPIAKLPILSFPQRF